MRQVLVYDDSYDVLEEIAEANDLHPAEVVDMLLDFVEAMKEEYDLR